MNRLPLITVFVVLLGACDGNHRDLVLVRPSADTDAAIVDNLVGLFNEESKLAIRLTNEKLAGTDALQAVADGRADIALVSNDQLFRNDIATILPLYATVLHIVQFGDQPDAIHVADLLRNATVYAGEPGSASRRVFERLTSGLDLGDEGYAFADEVSTDVGLAALFAPISPDRLAQYPEATLWSIGSPDEVGNGGPIDAIVLMNPHFRPFIIPAGTYGDATPAPVVTIAVDKLIVSRADLDRSIVYDLINEVLRLRPALGTIHPGLFRQVNEDFDVSRSRFIVHAGTQDYLQRSEPSFIERYSGVAEVLVTVLIASISASIAGLQIYARRRKNRIDRFYSAVIEIRNRAATKLSDAERRDAANEIRRLQNEAFALLVDEKLAADESFRIFMALCHDVLRQLD